MRDFRPPFLGQEDDDWFSWVATSPGRIDPATGELVESTAAAPGESKDMFDWVSTSPGRVNPKTGKPIPLTSLQKEKRRSAGGERRSPPPERGLSRFGAPSSRQMIPSQQGRSPVGMFDDFDPEMNGPSGVGCGTCSEMGDGAQKDGPGIALWLFVGTVAAITLEALGVTAWSKQR